ncbi:DNA polymerase II [Neptuniibacter sp. CAU 1671]|uniref:DNA polymerase II n=1 Tax=Neptuniibacter sp. CAU 1671 TaxID=3032593 RepID=UPI0023DB7D66|nr:DNA polymerase II [Neptuniibacter sp. CAU 1671]MDF2182113.1 DNA polymerase II [Neptuniibacter sp. CAU 1671]
MLVAQANSGFLLTRQQQDTAQGIRFTYWVHTAQGPQSLLVEQQNQVFFIACADEAQVRSLLQDLKGWHLADVALKDLQQQSVLALYCNSLALARQIIARLSEAEVLLMEEDIRAVDRYLMERFIQGGVRWGQGADGMLRLAPADISPQFRVLSIDLETTLRADRIISAAVYADDLQRVLMLGEGTNTDTVRYFADERALLRALIVLISEYDPDILIGWNVIEFDCRVLLRRAKQLAVPLKLGRDGSIMQMNDRGEGNSWVRIAGRVVLDGIDTLRGATWQFESFSLEYVAQQMLQRGKLIDHPSDRGEEIQRLFREDKTALARYNLEDCKLVWDIFAKAELLDYLTERARLTGLALDRVGGSAAAFDNQYLPRLHRAGYVAPPYASGMSGLGAPGGYVMDSAPGLYQQVLVLDFKSLYPSIIRTFCIDPMGLAEGLKPDAPADDLLPGFNHAIFSRTQHLLPDLIAGLWQARDRAKQRKNQPLSQAIKIIMNAFYGVLGSNVCRFYDQRLSSSITLRGHEILLKTKECIEQTFGFKVIYGDTDSVFVWLGDDFPDADAARQGQVLSEYLNQWWRENLQQRFALESFLEIEYETHYRRFMMPTIRHSEKGSKKRYAGLKISAQGEEKLVFRGLENVRSDWTLLARQFQEQLCQKIFHDEPWQGLVQQTVNAVRAGQVDDALVYRKRLRKPLAQYQKNRPPQVQAALKADQVYRARGQNSPFHSGSRIEYVMTVNGPEPLEFRQSPLDYQHYIDKQIRPVAESILQFLQVDFEQVITPQQTLF